MAMEHPYDPMTTLQYGPSVNYGNAVHGYQGNHVMGTDIVKRDKDAIYG